MAIEKVIPAPPLAPQRADPATFPARADAMVTYLAALVSDVNTWAGQANTVAEAVNTDQQTASAKAILAQAYAENAEGVSVVSGEYSAKHYSIKADKFANEAEDVEVSAGKYSAKHYALKAAASALLAQIEAPAAWNAGTSYSYPQVAVGSDGNTYRCLGTNVTGADPIDTPTSWVRLTGASGGGGSPVYNFENCGGF